jgi:hypothetical protein
MTVLKCNICKKHFWCQNIEQNDTKEKDTIIIDSHKYATSNENDADDRHSVELQHISVKMQHITEQ